MSILARYPIINKILHTNQKIKELTDDEEQNLFSVDPEKLFDVQIWDPVESKIIYRKLKYSKLPAGSRLYPYEDGLAYHYLGVYNNKYWPIYGENGHKRSKASSPLYLTIASKKPFKFMPVILKYGNNTLEKVKIGLIVGFAFAELIVLFMVVAAATGPGG